MKKFLTILLGVTLSVALTACKNTVTVYIPQTYVVTGGESKFEPVTFVYEEGWENKESFTVTYSLKTQDVVTNYTMTIGDKHTVTVVETGDIQGKSENYYDENGRMIRTVSEPNQDDVEKTETLFTYDGKGRVVSREHRLYRKNVTEPEVTVTQYINVDTEEGSKGSYTVGDRSVVERFYDKEGRVLREIIVIDGAETSRTEYTYDENGCETSTVSYYNGELSGKTVTTYQAVEISPEKARQLPQYVHTK